MDSQHSQLESSRALAADAFDNVQVGTDTGSRALLPPDQHLRLVGGLEAIRARHSQEENDLRLQQCREVVRPSPAASPSTTPRMLPPRRQGSSLQQQQQQQKRAPSSVADVEGRVRGIANNNNSRSSEVQRTSSLIPGGGGVGRSLSNTARPSNNDEPRRCLSRHQSLASLVLGGGGVGGGADSSSKSSNDIPNLIVSRRSSTVSSRRHRQSSHPTAGASAYLSVTPPTPGAAFDISDTANAADIVEMKPVRRRSFLDAIGATKKRSQSQIGKGGAGTTTKSRRASMVKENKGDGATMQTSVENDPYSVVVDGSSDDNAKPRQRRSQLSRNGGGGGSRVPSLRTSRRSSLMMFLGAGGGRNNSATAPSTEEEDYNEDEGNQRNKSVCELVEEDAAGPTITLGPGVIISGVDTTDASYREKVAAFLHTKPIQIILAILLLLDVVLVIVELVLQAHTECHMHIEPSLCSPPLSSSASHSSVSNDSGFWPPNGCGVFGESKVSDEIHHAEVIIVWISRAILMIFLAEIFTLIVCLGRHFFTLLYTIDLIIVATSLILSFIFDHNKKVESETALIVFLRCWRFARVLHGFGVTVHNVEKSTREHDEHTNSQDNGESDDGDDEHGGPQHKKGNTCTHNDDATADICDANDAATVDEEVISEYEISDADREARRAETGGVGESNAKSALSTADNNPNVRSAFDTVSPPAAAGRAAGTAVAASVESMYRRQRAELESYCESLEAEVVALRERLSRSTAGEMVT